MTPQPAVGVLQEQPVENIAAGAQAVHPANSPAQAQAGNAPARIIRLKAKAYVLWLELDLTGFQQ